MSVADALTFLREARRDEALVRELEALDDEVTWESLVRIGSANGLTFTSEELQRAHVLDWSMRRARYSAPETEDARGDD